MCSFYIFRPDRKGNRFRVTLPVNGTSGQRADEIVLLLYRLQNGVSNGELRVQSGTGRL